MCPCLHAAPAVRVLHVAHRILNELIVNFDLRPNTQLNNNNKCQQTIIDSNYINLVHCRIRSAYLY